MKPRMLSVLVFITIILFLAGDFLAGNRAFAQPASGREAGEKPHWAQGAFDFFKEKGLIENTSFGSFDEPVKSEDWNKLVSGLFGIAPGDDGVKSSLRWTISSYTVPEGRKQVLRGAGAAGLVQVLDLFGVIDLSSTSLSSILQEIGLGHFSSWKEAFEDWEKVDEADRLGVAVAVKEGLLSGYPGGVLRAKDPLTNGEALAIALRAVERYSLLDKIFVPRVQSVNVASLEADGLVMLMYSDKSMYKVGETVSIVAGVKNQRNTDIWCVGIPGGPWIELSARGPKGRVDLGASYKLPFYDVLVEKGPIAPGSWVVSRALYVPPDPGRYEVKMSFRPSQKERRPSKAATLDLDLTFHVVEPSPASLSRWVPR
ncbi:MAG TPA: S-layer homology domain-containing protein [Clostridia bacterium]|nr:S-layer homology domain-containing protein [Clostridia bacterium]